MMNSFINVSHGEFILQLGLEGTSKEAMIR